MKCASNSSADPSGPPVSNIKEAAERIADSGVSKKSGQNLDETDLEDWLGKEVVGGGDTSKIQQSSEGTVEGLVVPGLDSGTASGETAPPPKPGEEKPKSDSKSGDSGEAASEMLRKLRRFR